MKIIPRVKGQSLMLIVALFVCLGSSTQAAALQRSYLIDLVSKKMIDLGTLGGDSTSAYDINDAGQVVGYSVTSDGAGHAFMTGADGIGMRDLGMLFTGKVSVAHGINDAGQVVVVSDYGGNERSFITGPNGVGLANLGSLSGGDTRATAINNAGQVVGWSQVESSAHAFITGPNGDGMTYLGGGYSQAWDVNEGGQVAGAVGDLPARAFITGPNGKGMTVLGTLGGYDSWGWAINAAGQVAGESSGHPFITGPGGLGMRNLGAIGGDPGTGGSSRDINDAGQVVGTFWPKFESGPHAFITGPDGKNIVDLNSLVDIPDGVVLTEAVGINNMGQVVAFAQVIPEPKIYAMFLAGLGLIGYIARRRKYLGRADHWNFA